VRCSVCWF